MKMDRRRFIGATAGTAVATAIGTTVRTARALDPYDILIADQYANDVQFIQQEAGKYFGIDFKLADAPTTWHLSLGRYPGGYNGHPVDFHGYWIFRNDVHQCWQAVNYGNGPLDYWNKDGRAAGNPEDWELFGFEAVNKADQTVKVYNKAYIAHRQFMTGEHYGSDWKYYVNLVGDQFSCNDTQANAAVFVVKFL